MLSGFMNLYFSVYQEAAIDSLNKNSYYQFFIYLSIIELPFNMYVLYIVDYAYLHCFHFIIYIFVKFCELSYHIKTVMLKTIFLFLFKKYSLKIYEIQWEILTKDK